jgi:hypothetical protein
MIFTYQYSLIGELKDRVTVRHAQSSTSHLCWFCALCTIVVDSASTWKQQLQAAGAAAFDAGIELLLLQPDIVGHDRIDAIGF